MFLDTSQSLTRLIVVGPATYLAVLVLLRISGARTLAKLNAFDFVVTVAFGSVLAAAFVNDNVTLAAAVITMTVLIGLQWVVARLVRHKGIRDAATAAPVLLVAHGEIRSEAAEGARVTRDQIHQATRSVGQGDLGRVAAAVLETDGTISIITQDNLGDGRSLEHVPGWAPPGDERADRDGS